MQGVGARAGENRNKKVICQFAQCSALHHCSVQWSSRLWAQYYRTQFSSLKQLYYAQCLTKLHHCIMQCIIAKGGALNVE